MITASSTWAISQHKGCNVQWKRWMLWMVFRLKILVLAPKRGGFFWSFWCLSRRIGGSSTPFLLSCCFASLFSGGSLIQVWLKKKFKKQKQDQVFSRTQFSFGFVSLFFLVLGSWGCCFHVYYWLTLWIFVCGNYISICML